MLLSDLRELGRRSFPDARLIAQLLSHFSPQVLKTRENANEPTSGEVVTPEKLRTFPADLSTMGAFLSRTS